MLRGTAIALLSVLGCWRPGEIRYSHQIVPEAEDGDESYRLSVERVTGLPAAGTPYGPLPQLWFEMEVQNRGDAPWELEARALSIDPGEQVAVGFAARPGLLQAAGLSDRLLIAPRSVQRTWVKFEGVETSHRPAAQAGVDLPVSLSLLLRRPDGGELSVQLSDVASGAPLWEAPAWPYFAMFTLGTGLGTSFEREHAAMTFDVGVSAHRRLGEMDVGLLGSVRGGIETLPLQGGAYSFLGGGVTVGHTLHVGRALYARPALGVVLGRAGHPVVVTTPVSAIGEVHLGVTRRSLYPYRNRRTDTTVGVYVRAEAIIVASRRSMSHFGSG